MDFSRFRTPSWNARTLDTSPTGGGRTPKTNLEALAPYFFCDACSVWWDRKSDEKCWNCGDANVRPTSAPTWASPYFAVRLMSGPGAYIPGWTTMAALEQDLVA